MSPYRIVYRKACHLPVEIQHRALWAIKHVNMSLDAVGGLRFLWVNDLYDMRIEEYKNYKLSKESMKAIHDERILPKTFHIRQQVIL